jgi:hypothetical protein
MKNIFIFSAAALVISIVAGTSSYAAIPKKVTTTPSKSVTTLITTAPKTTIKPGYSALPKASNCPVNTYIITGTTLCVDGTNLYGLFSDQMIKKCIAKNGGKACTTKYSMLNQYGTIVTTNRYNYNFYLSLNK